MNKESIVKIRLEHLVNLIVASVIVAIFTTIVLFVGRDVFSSYQSSILAKRDGVVTEGRIAELEKIYDVDTQRTSYHFRVTYNVAQTRYLSRLIVSDRPLSMGQEMPVAYVRNDPQKAVVPGYGPGLSALIILLAFIAIVFLSGLYAMKAVLWEIRLRMILRHNGRLVKASIFDISDRYSPSAEEQVYMIKAQWQAGTDKSYIFEGQIDEDPGKPEFVPVVFNPGNPEQYIMDFSEIAKKARRKNKAYIDSLFKTMRETPRSQRKEKLMKMINEELEETEKNKGLDN